VAGENVLVSEKGSKKKAKDQKRGLNSRETRGAETELENEDPQGEKEWKEFLEKGVGRFDSRENAEGGQDGRDEWKRLGGWEPD